MSMRSSVKMQSTAGAKRMVAGLLAHEMSRHGICMTPAMEEKIMAVYIALRGEGFSNIDMMQVLEGYVMRLQMES